MKQLNKTGTKEEFEAYWWGVLTTEQRAVNPSYSNSNDLLLTKYNSHTIQKQPLLYARFLHVAHRVILPANYTYSLQRKSGRRPHSLTE